MTLDISVLHSLRFLSLVDFTLLVVNLTCIVWIVQQCSTLVGKTVQDELLQLFGWLIKLILKVAILCAFMYVVFSYVDWMHVYKSASAAGLAAFWESLSKQPSST
jgi:hypothetical protein